ncbi:carboxypeptidase-like regulatory domain-containing protein, partial [Winogradskyella sp. UBA3174]
MYIKTFILLFGFSLTFAQNESIKGSVTFDNESIAYAKLTFSGNGNYSTFSDENGNFKVDMPFGAYKIKVRSLGLKVKTQTIEIDSNNSTDLKIILVEDFLGLDEVVVSATRNRVNKKEAPIIVNTLGEKLINATQALTVSETLNYAPGVRVETNCQNCGFTQVRLNGLDG